MIYLVSACLVGINCKYDGGNNERAEIVELVKQGNTIPICPEQLGGLKTPRPPAEIENGGGCDVLEGISPIIVSSTGENVTEQFIKGAYETLKIALLVNPDTIFLKQKSPSCGCGKIYNNHILIEGDGVTTALLKKHGFNVKSVD